MAVEARFGRFRFGALGFAKVGYGSHGTEVVRSDWSRSVKVGSVMVG